MATQTMTTQTDPVCGMQVVPGRAPSSVHEGTTYYFCCGGCKAKFDQAPAEFPKAGGTSSDKGGCCCG